MRLTHTEPLTPDLVAELEALEAKGGESINTTDIPETLDWSGVARGFYRPVKKPYSIRLDTDVVAWFKASGHGYQTRINAALREYVQAHTR